MVACWQLRDCFILLLRRDISFTLLINYLTPARLTEGNPVNTSPAATQADSVSCAKQRQNQQQPPPPPLPAFDLARQGMPAESPPRELLLLSSTERILFTVHRAASIAQPAKRYGTLRRNEFQKQAIALITVKCPAPSVLCLELAVCAGELGVKCSF